MGSDAHRAIAEQLRGPGHDDLVMSRSSIGPLADAFVRPGRARYARAQPDARCIARFRASRDVLLGLASTLENQLAVVDQSNATRWTKLLGDTTQLRSTRASEENAAWLKGIGMGALFLLTGGSVAVAAVGGWMGYNDYHRLSAMDTSLERASRGVQSAGRLAQSITWTRNVLTPRLAAIRATAEPFGLWGEGVRAGAPEHAYRLAQHLALIDHARRTIGQLTAIVQTLRTLIGSAEQEAAALTSLIADLERSLASAEQMYSESLSELHNAWNIATSGDPSGAAERWLEDHLLQRVRAELFG
jgi:hypothetical protein